MSLAMFGVIFIQIVRHSPGWPASFNLQMFVFWR